MTLSILGSTGSIGTQSLEVARKHSFEVAAVTANKNVEVIEAQIREFNPKIAVMADENAAKDLKIKVSDTSTKVLCGIDGMNEAASLESADIVLNSLVGMIGLVPTVTAINAGKNIALSNKETLVAGGDFVMNLALRQGVKILPVDSEHSAIFQCLQGAAPNNALKRLILTASGGPFFGYNKKQLENVKAKDALRHPNWSMGAKITIDCATMMNKGLEVIEAVHLFNLPQDKIDVVIHRESIIHSMVEYNDNSVIAQLGLPDMRIPIQYALTYPNRYPSPVETLDLAKVSKLSFFEPDNDTFICLDVCRKAIKQGGLVPAAVNGANEEAVKLFLNDKITFNQIGEIAQMALEMQKSGEYTSIDQVLEADKAAREMVKAKYN